MLTTLTGSRTGCTQLATSADSLFAHIDISKQTKNKNKRKQTDLNKLKTKEKGEKRNIS